MCSLTTPGGQDREVDEVARRPPGPMGASQGAFFRFFLFKFDAELTSSIFRFVSICLFIHILFIFIFLQYFFIQIYFIFVPITKLCIHMCCRKKNHEPFY
jgi:hypothetical protein